ncbi:MAG: hypothetical protein PHE63_02915 [Eubacteriales bacterium]|nr:hypothetical protein [Eubacteriales bacterium]
MNWAKTLKTISNSIYIVGVVIVLCLGTISLFGSNETIDTTAMIPFTWKEQAFIWLALGTIPMLLACMAVYKFNAIKDKTQKKRNFIFIFFPGFICSACALFVIGVIIVGMINTLGI